MISWTTFAFVQPWAERHTIGTVFLALVVAVVLVELAGFARQRPEARRRDAGSLILMRLCVAGGGVVAVWAPTWFSAADIRPPSASVIAAIVLLAGGEGMRIWAKTALGRYFTYTVMTSADQPVVTSGPYRWLRHPSYSGALLIVLAVGAYWGNWVSVAALLAAAAIGVGYRIFVEERALVEELGDPYRAFAATRKRIIPFVW